MADTVAVTLLDNTSTYQQTRLRAHLTCVSDGTGESAVVKLNPANYNSYTKPGSAPVAASGFTIEVIEWAIRGFSYIQLDYRDSGGTHILGLLPGGDGHASRFDYGTKPGDLALPEYQRPVGIPNTAGTVGAGGGATPGAIYLTSVGAVSGATYDITLKVFLVPVGNV